MPSSEQFHSHEEYSSIFHGHRKSPSTYSYEPSVRFGWREQCRRQRDGTYRFPCAVCSSASGDIDSGTHPGRPAERRWRPNSLQPQTTTGMSRKHYRPCRTCAWWMRQQWRPTDWMRPHWGGHSAVCKCVCVCGNVCVYLCLCVWLGCSYR